jgi:ferredoxin
MASLYVDKEECVKCNLCVDEYPQAFKRLADGPAEVYNQDILSKDQIDDVVSICPASCIHYK